MIDAAAYLDIPFAPKGRSRAGVDCWGLVRLVTAEQLGRDLPSWSEYDSVAPCAETAAHLAACATAFARVADGEEAPGDILLFNVGGRPAHVALCLGGGRMLHVHEGIDVAIERYLSPRWLPRLEGVYRHG